MKVKYLDITMTNMNYVSLQINYVEIWNEILKRQGKMGKTTIVGKNFCDKNE